MKKIIKLSVIAFAFLAMPSCKKFLEENPPSAYTPANYYKSLVQAQNAVNGIYASISTLYSQGGNFDDLGLLLLEMPTGQSNTDISQSTNNQELLHLNTSSANLYVRQWWRTSYKGIDAANLAITNISAMPASVVSATQKSQLVGQAQFLRAWFYFNLVRIYGDVPLLTTPTTGTADSQIPRNPTKDIYEKLIVPDLLSAEQSGLPFADQTGRVSLGAVKGLLAKVYETMAGYPLQQADKHALAKQKALEVISSNQFTLYSNYDQFRDPSNDNKMENIFMAQFSSKDLSNPLFAQTLPLFQPISGVYSGNGALTPDLTFYKSFKPGDKRGQEDQYFFSHYANHGSGADVVFSEGQHIFKYFDNVSYANNTQSGKCFPIIRLTDIMLLCAEAQNEADGTPDANSYTYLNQIRSRAGLAPLTALSQSQFRQAVWRERNHELCYENITWFDMVRTRMAYDTKNDAFVPLVGYTFPYGSNITFQTKNLLFPLPQSEIQANPKLTQNTGY
ncbi:RagB/SusD family nutrient uptake outer membrane protein [Mucilaginibacter sp. RCC_168]|uniref:RagB/SusD family nutrient uptake outer membrane protein n=1 Tax=Mucilaginibacter sp. RCC_168 TaxID=3239221 RepID=UPI00352452F9